MLVDAVLDVLQAVVEWVVSLIPSFPTSFVSGVGDSLASVGEKAAPLSFWFNFTVFITVVTVLLALRGGCLIVSVAVKVYAMIRGGAS